MTADRADAAPSSADSATPARRRWRVHWVIAELDAYGEIDEHAAMCLRHAVEASPTRAIETVLVDLRDLAAITPAGLALFVQHTAYCQAHGVDLGLLINRNERNDTIGEAFALAGLGDQLHNAGQPRLAAPTAPVGDEQLRSAGRGRIGRAAQRCSPRRRPRAQAPS